MTKTPRDFTSASLRINRSTFTGILIPISSIDNLTLLLKNKKKEFSKARHFCWAYRLTIDGYLMENSSDAGEPSGTAGLPILHALQRHSLMQCGLIVIRVFGGIKLGKRGLIDAYGDTATTVIHSSRFIQWIEYKSYCLVGDQKSYGEYFRILENHGGKLVKDMSESELKWIINIPLKTSESYTREMNINFMCKLNPWREE